MVSASSSFEVGGGGCDGVDAAGVAGVVGAGRLVSIAAGSGATSSSSLGLSSSVGSAFRFLVSDTSDISFNGLEMVVATILSRRLVGCVCGLVIEVLVIEAWSIEH